MNSVIGKLRDTVEQSLSNAQGQVQLKNLLCHLRAQLRILEKNRSERLSRLGLDVLRKHQGAAIEGAALAAQLSELEDLERQIAEKRRESEACLQMLYGNAGDPGAGWTCRCGGHVRAGFRFCPSCGRAAPWRDPESTGEDNHHVQIETAALERVVR